MIVACDHKKTKPKLVSWATNCRYGHEQGFATKNCCVACGAIVPSVDNNKGNQMNLQQQLTQILRYRDAKLEEIEFMKERVNTANTSITSLTKQIKEANKLNQTK